MLQEEFYERTKVSLSLDEYREVEKIYTHVQMGKDEFCKWWLESRDNRIIKELMDSIELTERRSSENYKLYDETMHKLGNLKNKWDDEIAKIKAEHKDEMASFARRVLIHKEDSDMVYDDIVETLGLDFVIKTKVMEYIPMTDEERRRLFQIIDSNANNAH